MDKKLVLPGDHLSSAEESESGENTYSDNDEVYSTAAGENTSSPGHAAVKTKGRTIRQPFIGMPVYCLITKASLNKAIGGCVSVEEAEGGARGVEIEAVLPVTAIRHNYVRDIRDEVKIGDIIKVKIEKITKTGYDVSMMAPDCGVVVCFCPRCRQKMDLSERIFVCGRCGWKERRKLPLKEGEVPPPEPEGGRFERRDRGFDRRPRGSPGFKRREHGSYRM